ncbi:hypothetical protein [Phenylobacterium sp.]|uniref:hypothetical protein n=1 Tax=Phenylobacterium sp. TaxID=1871053 RepID=UPI002732A232|nr:hypothetical protein [Phenylobacterium sp.]MDP3854441.1 hypothetical protein [Phenylobacterium sp.]
MRVIAMLFVSLVAGCATPGAPEPALRPQADGLARQAPSHLDDLKRQRAEVEDALRPLEAAHTASLFAIDQEPPKSGAEDADAHLEDLLRAHREGRRLVLEPLAARGSSEAMMRLASDLRDGSSPDDWARWLSLVTRASQLGDPLAHDELVRWYWHQRGDGSIEQVQANRAIALAFAGRAAEGGNMWGIISVATYIAGDVHQYPANLPLARRLMELCARTDSSFCQEVLAGGSSYDYGQSPTEVHLWLSRLAARAPVRFAPRRDLAWSRLTVEERVAAERIEEAWRPAPWSELRPEWRDIQRDIARHGETSAGVLDDCTTSKPWCRGRSTLPQ